MSHPPSADHIVQDAAAHNAFLIRAFPGGEEAERVRGLGAGRRLLLSLLKRAQNAGQEWAFLEVRPSNLPALALYRSTFKPSATLARPHAMVAVTIVAADTDAQARHLGAYMQAQVSTPLEREMAERYRTPEAVMAETAMHLSLAEPPRT